MDTDSPEKRPQSRSRLEDEVLEILHKTDRPPSNVVKFRAHARRRRMVDGQRLRSVVQGFQLTSLQLIIATLGLALLAVFVEGHSALLARGLALLSVACLVAIFVRRFRRPEPPQTKTWRGRDIQFRPPGSGTSGWRNQRPRR